jgi:hypothetical protein
MRSRSSSGPAHAGGTRKAGSAKGARRRSRPSSSAAGGHARGELGASDRAARARLARASARPRCPVRVRGLPQARFRRRTHPRRLNRSRVGSERQGGGVHRRAPHRLRAGTVRARDGDGGEASRPRADARAPAGARIILRHVWLAAHRRTEEFGGFTIGDKAGQPAAARVGDVIAKVGSGNVSAMVNPYADAHG